MPLATLDDLAGVGGAATLDDIATIEPPTIAAPAVSAPATAGRATLADIAAVQPPAVARSTWDRRADGSAKGDGFLGVLRRPDGGVSSELSMGTTDINGRETEIPLLVPTLTRDEVNYLLSAPADDWKNPVMRGITAKAVDFARRRQQQGQPFFAVFGEQQADLYPDIPRASMARPSPVVAQGFTQPDSVHVTPAPVPVAPKNPPGYFNPKTGEQLHPGPIGTVPIVDAPGVGIPQIVRGAAALARGVVAPLRTDASGRPVGTKTPVADLVKPPMLAGASDVLEGGFKTLEPVVAVTGAAAPLETGAALAEAAAASEIGTRAAKAVGLSPEAQRLAGNVAAFGGGSLGTRQVLEKLRKGGAPEPAVSPSQAREVPQPPASAASPVEPPEPQTATVADVAAIEPPPTRTGPVEGQDLGALVDNPHAIEAPPRTATVEDISAIEPPPAPVTAEPPTEPPATPAPPPTEDVLDTGEKQPRLPGAESVREENKATPQVADVPFSLEPETATRTPAQPTLREESDAETPVSTPPQLEERPPAAAAPAPEAAAPPVPETPGRAEVTTPPKREPRGVRAAPATLDTLSVHERREVRRILAEIDARPFEPKRFHEADKGGAPDVEGGAAGARVYYDIVGGDADHRPSFGYSRGAVAAKIRAFIDQGKRSVASDLAVDVARRRLAGERGMQKPELPVEAGDEPGRIYVQPLKGLDERRAAVQTRAADVVESTPAEELVARYRARFGNVVNADNAKELLPGYSTPAERTANDLAVHRPAAAVAQRVYEQMLEHPPADRDPFVIMTMGGTGSGKSTGLNALFPPEAQQRATAIFDSVGTNRQVMRRNIEMARRLDLEVAVVLSDRDVTEAFRGTLERARETGRPVTLNTHVATHLQAPEVFQELARAYPDANESGVSLFVVRHGADRPELIPLSDWQPRSYNESDVRTRLEGLLGEETAAGRVSPALADAIRPTLPAREALASPADAEPLRRPHGTDAESRAADAGPTEGLPEEPLSRPFGSRRADPSGALIPSPASRVITGLQKERQLRPSEIVRELSKALDALPIKVGKFRQHALGIYKPKEQTIRLKVANDLDTLAHELGHHIHETVLGQAVPYQLYKQELLALGKPTSRSSYSQKQILQEGQAEFTRYYLGDPASAQKLAPTYYQAFEQGLAKFPQLEAIIQRAQRQYVGYLSQDPVTRGMARIDFDGVDPRPKGDLLTRLETAWVDDLAPLRHMTQDLRNGGPVNVAADGYALARLARGASAKADGFLRHGVRDVNGTFLAGALEPALRPVRGRMQEFAAYLVASRVPDLKARGMETGMTGSEAAAIRKKFQSPAFDAARQAVYDYQDGVIEYARRSGLIADAQVTAMRKLNQHYVPFQRVLDEVGAAAGGGRRGLANTPTATKRIKGSGRDIINPLESIVKNTHAIVALAEQNKAMLALVDQAGHTTGGGRYLERIPDKLKATTFNLGDLEDTIRKSLASDGIDLPFSDRPLFDEMVTIFQPTHLRLGERGIVSVLRRGEREWYSVNEPALFDALAAAPPKATNLVYQLLEKPARLLRAGATTTLGFIARNPIRDTFEATVNSRYGFRPGYDTVRGLFAYLERGEDYQQFLNSGAGNSALVSADRGRVQEELQRLGLGARKRILDTVAFHPVQLLQAVSEAMEQATRLGEFKRGLEHEGRSPEGYARAALAARDVTIDFGRGGTESKTLNRYVAFFNAGVQGTARLAEVFSRDPVGATMRATAAITVPSLALWALNQDDPDYHELPAWERNTYWHIPIGRELGHGWVRLPKPFSLGAVFGNVPEAALDYVSKADPEGLKRVLPDKDTAWHQLAGVIGNALLPLYEVASNYDTFRGRAIVNPYDLGLDKELQYNRWTSEFAKTVGPKIGLAPAVLDHLIYGYGAGFAQGVTKGLDPLFGGKGKPAGGPAGWPLVGAFYRDAPRTDAESLQRFYELRDAFAGAEGSIRRYEKAGDDDRARARVQQLLHDAGANAAAVRQRIREADSTLKELRDGVNQVFENGSMTPARKRDELARLATAMVNVARYGLGEGTLEQAKSGSPKAAPPVAPKADATSR